MAGTKKNRPDFHEAASGEKAKELYDYFFGRVQALYVTDKVKNGVFQAMMQVDLRNDGPVCRYHSKDSRVPPSKTCNYSVLISYTHAGYDRD